MLAKVNIDDAVLIPEVCFTTAIELLYKRYCKRGQQRSMVEKGVSLAEIYADRAAFSRAMASAVNQGHYKFSTKVIERILVKQKQRRLIISASLTDLILQRALYLYFKERENHLICVNKHPLQFVKNIAYELKSRSAGFCITGDILKYTENIPNAYSSDLWKIIQQKYLLAYPDKQRTILMQLLFRCSHPAANKKNKKMTALYGLPMGSPVTQFLGNEYLTVLDQAMMNLSGIKYYRYFDDFIIFTDTHPQMLQAQAIIQNCLEKLQLTLNPHKAASYCLADDSAQRLSKLMSLTVLGYKISITGEIGLAKKQVQRLLKSVRFVAMAARKLTDSDQVFIKMINQSLQPHSQADNFTITTMLHHCTNRTQLKELDYYIARICAEVLTGCHGVRAFRIKSYRHLREAGLISFCYTQNLRLRRLYEKN